MLRKIADGWSVGTPTVTTCVGAEGMYLESQESSWGGLIGNHSDEIVKNCVDMYNNEILWRSCQNNGFEIIEKKFNLHANVSIFLEKVDYIINNKDSLRKQNFVGEILWMHGHRYQQYFSKYLETKNELQRNKKEQQSIAK